MIRELYFFMKYLLSSVLLSATLILTAAEKKDAAPAKTEPVPAPAAEKTSFVQRLSDDTGKMYRKIRRKTVKALDITGNRRIRDSIEAARADRISKAYAAGSFMAEHFADKKIALLLSGPVDSVDNKALIEAFNKTAAGKVQVITIAVDTGKNSLPLPDEEPTVAALNDALFKSIADGADALVNFAGLPSRNSHCSKLIFWQWGANDPRVYLADAPDTLLLKEKLFPCPFAAVAVRRLLTEDEAETAVDFNARYILLTKKNLKTSGVILGK